MLSEIVEFLYLEYDNFCNKNFSSSAKLKVEKIECFKSLVIQEKNYLGRKDANNKL